MQISAIHKNSVFWKKIQSYDIILYVISFVLFLALDKEKLYFNMLISLVVMIICSILVLNKDKPYYNMLNSLGVMICFIKLLDICLGKWMKCPIKFFQRIFWNFWLSQNIKKYTANERWDQLQ